MSDLGIILIPLLKVLAMALNIYMWMVIIAALITWVNPDPYNPLVRFLYSVTEPVLAAIRRRLPFAMSGIDFTPMIVILIIVFLVNVIEQLLLRF